MAPLQELLKIIAAEEDPKELQDFFEELFTPRELQDLGLRWQLLKELFQGEAQRAIASRHRISLCKITRGSKILKKENSASLRILKSQLMD